MRPGCPISGSCPSLAVVVEDVCARARCFATFARVCDRASFCPMGRGLVRDLEPLFLNGYAALPGWQESCRACRFAKRWSW
eukprot:9493288-Pyramimonas_sp.AAC.1